MAGTNQYFMCLQKYFVNSFWGVKWGRNTPDISSSLLASLLVYLSKIDYDVVVPKFLYKKAKLFCTNDC